MVKKPCFRIFSCHPLSYNRVLTSTNNDHNKRMKKGMATFWAKTPESDGNFEPFSENFGDKNGQISSETTFLWFQMWATYWPWNVDHLLTLKPQNVDHLSTLQHVHVGIYIYIYVFFFFFLFLFRYVVRLGSGPICFFWKLGSGQF